MEMLGVYFIKKRDCTRDDHEYLYVATTNLCRQERDQIKINELGVCYHSPAPELRADVPKELELINAINIGEIEAGTGFNDAEGDPVALPFGEITCLYKASIESRWSQILRRICKPARQK